VNIFNKLKTKRNDKIAYYKFPAKSFTSERIANLCLQTKIDSFFIEVYGLPKNDIADIKTNLFGDGIDVAMNLKKQEERLVVSISVIKMQSFLKYITGFDFDEILIWDRYTTIDQFLQNGQNLSNTKNDESKFFLDYNKYENGYAELYLAPVVDSQDIQKILSEVK